MTVKWYSSNVIRRYIWAVGLLSLCVCANFGFVALANAQSNDSEENQFDGVTGIPLVKQIITKARQMETHDIRQAIDMMLQREKEVKRVSTNAQMAAYYNKIAELNATIDSIAVQHAYAEKGLALLGDETVAIGADLNFNLGLVYEMRADYAKAKSLYAKGLYIAQQTGHDLYEARGHLFLAAIFSNEGNFDLALTTASKAYAIATQINNADFNWELYNEMSILYTNLDDQPRAEEFALKALQSAQALNIPSLQTVALHNIAYTYLATDQLDKASNYFEQMLDLSKKNGDLSDLHYAYKGFALVAIDKKQFERALAYINKAKEYLSAVEVTLAEVEFYIIKAKVLNGLEQTNQALELLITAEQLMPIDRRGIKSPMGLRVLNDRSKYHAELGEHRRAYNLLLEHSIGYRKYERSRNDEALQRLRVSFDVERNQTRNDILQKDNEIKSLQLKRADDERYIQTFFLMALGILSSGLIIVMYRQFHARRQLKFFAQTDSLTGLHNRGYIFAKGRQVVAAHQEAQSTLCIMMFDADHFKQINDKYGHPAGDEVLRVFGRLSQECLRDSDIIARFGGEEFIALLPDVDLETAEFIANRLKDKLQQYQQQVDGESFSVTASFGVVAARKGESFEQLVQRVDNALYEAKENGRNCIVVVKD